MQTTEGLPLWVFAVVLAVLFIGVPAALILLFYRKVNALQSSSAKKSDRFAAADNVTAARETSTGQRSIERLRDAQKLQGFAKGLDAVSAALRSVYRIMLYVVLALGTALIVYIFIASRGDVNAPFLRFWFGLVFLAFLLWVLGRIGSLRREESDLSDLPEFFWKTEKESDKDIGLDKTTFEFGMKPRDRATEPDFRWNFGFNFGSAPAEARPDEAAVAKAEEYLRQGESWEAICRRVHSDYSQWESERQRFYQECLKAMVALRAAKHGQGPTSN